MKRFLKSMALEFAKKRNGFSSIGFSKFLLDMMKIDFEPTQNAIYQNGSSAVCVISIDFDHLTKSPESTSNKWLPIRSDALLAKNRIGTRDLLKVSEQYQIPMTWAICGQTAQEDLKSYEGIRESKQFQEIGVHTYSHIDVSACSESELEVEIEKCLDVLKLDRHPKTFIFPWNRQGHFEKLKQMGFITYRDQKRSVSSPKLNRSLWNIPPTYYVDQKSFKAQNLIRNYLDLCISWNAVFHLWLHPWSVVLEDNEGRFVNDTLGPLFSYMKEKRGEGKLAVVTMGQLAEFYEESASKIRISASANQSVTK